MSNRRALTKARLQRDRRKLLNRKLTIESLESRQLLAVVSAYAGPAAIEGSTSPFIVERDSADSSPLVVNYSLSGTATQGSDYPGQSGTVTILANETFALINIAATNDADPEPDETIILTLASGSYTIGSSNTGIITIPMNDGYLVQSVFSDLPPVTMPDTTDQRIDPCNCGPKRMVSANQNVQPAAPRSVSSRPVRYSDGTVIVTSTDLYSTGFGIPWGVTRDWTNALGYQRSNVVGHGMVLDEQPTLADVGSGSVALVTNGHTARYFDLVSSSYEGRGFIDELLTYNSSPDEFTLTNSDGSKLVLFGFGSAHPTAQKGQLKSYTDQYGNTTSVSSRDGNGNILEMQRSSTVGSTTITESFLYTYVPSGNNAGLVESIAMRHRENAGAWVTERKVVYAYYDSGEPHGNIGDLKTATIEDGSSNVLDTTYYRYYKPGETGGYEHGLKYVVLPESYERLVAAEGSNLATITDFALSAYADNYFEYDSQQRATKEIAQGAGCSSCSGGQGSFTFSYVSSSNSPGTNSWAVKTTETLPDGNQNIVYTNLYGQVMLKVFRDSVTSDEWATYYKYDADGRLLWQAEPSAVSGYDDGFADLVNESGGDYQYLRDNQGLITTYSYYASTSATTTVAGGVAGYLDEVSVREGEDGTPIPQLDRSYIAATSGGSTIYLVAAETVYESVGGADPLTTEYAYTFISGTLGVESQTTTLPTGSSDQETVYFDSYNRPVWQKDLGGFLHYLAYDQLTGAVTKAISDVDTTQTSDFTGKPSGWTTPSGGGEHAVILVEVDGLGRPTKSTDANGSDTFTVYDDVGEEIRIYPGWDSVSGTTTGPTTVVRMDSTGTYTEVLTMLVIPAVASGEPTGAEAISNIESLTRTFYNDAGQAIHTDDYFQLNGLTYSTSVTLGTEGTHFHRTEMGYDKRGRLARLERADGTIYRTVFDGLGRPVSEWIGDDDTPTSGFWSPTNAADMVKIKEYQYDSGGIGDSHLTRVTDAITRHTTLEYDFRGRLIQTTLPDPDGAGSLGSPVYLAEYDNLGRVIEETDALNNVTSYSYDVVTRETTLTMPDPDGAGSQASPVLTTVLDAFGRLASQTDPLGAVTTSEYDGLGRLIKMTQADPDLAGSLTSPITEFEFDGMGNVRFVTDPLGNVTEYVYDDRHRLVEIVQADPDGTGPLASPTTHLAYNAANQLMSETDPLGRETTYQYDAFGRLVVKSLPDPDGLGPLFATSIQYTYDAAGRLVSITQLDVEVDEPTDSGFIHVSDNESSEYTPPVGGILGTMTNAGHLGSHDVMDNHLGSPTYIAKWNVDLPAGVYRVSVTWVSSYFRPTSVKYSVRDTTPNGAGTLEEHVYVNQQNAPDDFTYDGSSWNVLGTYTITSGGIQVDLTSDPNEVISVDAIHIELIEAIEGPVFVNDASTGGYSDTSGFSTLDGWGYGGSFRQAPKKTSSFPLHTATWTFDVPVGQYEVAATWLIHTNRATNAPYTISVTGGGTFTVNQQVEPASYELDGSDWHSFGVVSNTTGRITVTLTNNANGYVQADAVRIVRVGDLESRQTIDNNTSGYSSVGTCTSASGGYGSSYRYNAAGTGADKATWTYTVEPGQYRVAATWPSNASAASNAPFTVRDGSTTLATVNLNQQVAPNDYQSLSSWWEIVGTYSITGTSLVVELSDNANSTVRADAVQILRVGDLPTAPSADVQILDDGDSGYTASGTWGAWISGYWGDYRYANGGSGAAEAIWTATVDPGLYRVSATWIAAVNRATDAPFTIFDGTTNLGTTHLDQEVSPSSFNDAGVAWQDIGIVEILSGSLIVKLTDDANEYVIADAIRIERVDGSSSGRTTSYEYDLQDRLVKVTAPDPDGAGPLTPPETEYEYDLAGQLLSMTDPEGRVTSYQYDALGRLLTTTQPDPDGAGSLAAPVSAFSYDPVGNLLSTTDPLSHVTSYLYDNLYRRTKTTDAETGETDFTYDAAGQMLSLTDPVGNTTTWEYDLLGRVIEETNELNKTRTFKYDAVGNLTERIDRLGRKTTWDYDGLYRNTAEKWYDGASLVRTLSFQYDAASQLTAASDPTASYGYSYDNLGRVTTETQDLDGLNPVIAYESTYDGDNRRTGLQAFVGGKADFKNSYTYDNLDRLTSLQQADVSEGSVVADKRIDFAYNVAGQYESISRFADQAATEFVANTFYSYDGMGRLSKLLHTEDASAPGSGWGTSPLAGYNYTYDAASRITSIESYLDGLTDYSHDDTNQLTAADHASITDESYTYDENGNRTGGGYDTDPNNQLASDGTYNYTYDDEGNRLTKTKISNNTKEEFTWDHRNRLTKVTFKNSGGTVTKSVDYKYDAFNQLIRRTLDPDGATGSAALVDAIFSWEADQINLQFDGINEPDLTQRYLWNPTAIDQILAVEDVTSLASAGTVKWPLTDHLGTARDIASYNATTDDTSVSNHRVFDSYGKLISQTNSSFTIAFGFTGVYFDVTTSYNYHRNRWYDLNVGQWISEDPIEFAAGDQNLRRYISNSPTNSIDPSGLVEPNHEAFRMFLTRWGAGPYFEVDHIFRQQFYDSDPIVGPYLQGHGFMKDDTRNLIPLPTEKAYAAGYEGSHAAHLGRHCSSSTRTLRDNILQIHKMEKAGDITIEQAVKQLQLLQRAERLALRTNPTALHKPATVAQHQAIASRTTTRLFSTKPSQRRGIMVIPKMPKLQFAVPKMPSMSPMVKEGGAFILLNFGEGILTHINEEYCDGELGRAADHTVYYSTFGLMGSNHPRPLNSEESLRRSIIVDYKGAKNVGMTEDEIVEYLMGKYY
jgi:RHS repeat-associated protein